MKKIFSLVLVVLMLCTLSTNAFALTVASCHNCGVQGSIYDCPECGGDFCEECHYCEDCGKYVNRYDTVVEYGVDDSYTITIPDAVTIGSDGTGAMDVSVSNALLIENSMLGVYIDGDSYADNHWHLTDEFSSDNKLAYDIAMGETAIVPDSRIVNVLAGEAWNSTVTQNLTLKLADDVTKAGLYVDELTFYVEYAMIYEDTLYIATVDGEEQPYGIVFTNDNNVMRFEYIDETWVPTGFRTRDDVISQSYVTKDAIFLDGAVYSPTNASVYFYSGTYESDGRDLRVEHTHDSVTITSDVDGSIEFKDGIVYVDDVETGVYTPVITNEYMFEVMYDVGNVINIAFSLDGHLALLNINGSVTVLSLGK